MHDLPAEMVGFGVWRVAPCDKMIKRSSVPHSVWSFCIGVCLGLAMVPGDFHVDLMMTKRCARFHLIL